MLAIAVIQVFITGSNEPRQVTIGLTGGGVTYADPLEVGNDDLAPTTETVDDGIARLEQGAIDVLFDGTALTWDGLPDFTLDSYVRDTVQQATFGQRAEDLGLSSDDLGQLFAPVEIEEIRLDGGNDEFGVRFAAAGISGLATFMLLQIWGSFLTMGVIRRSRRKWSRSCSLTFDRRRC